MARVLQLSGRRVVAGIPILWLLVLFLIPFIIVFRISLSEVRLAIPPYTPLLTWHHGSPLLQLHWSSYAFLFTDSLYVSSYLYSLKVAAVSTLCSSRLMGRVYPDEGPSTAPGPPAPT